MGGRQETRKRERRTDDGRNGIKEIKQEVVSAQHMKPHPECVLEAEEQPHGALPSLNGLQK